MQLLCEKIKCLIFLGGGGGGVSFDASNGEVSASFSTTSSQITMQGILLQFIDSQIN